MHVHNLEAYAKTDEQFSSLRAFSLLSTEVLWITEIEINPLD